MGVMTAQPPLPLTPSGGVAFGAVAALVQDEHGGRVFIRGELCFVWDGGDEAGRRLAAIQLVRIKAASGLDVAAAFGVSVVTLWRWRKQLDAAGTAALAWHKRGPKGPSLLSDDMAAEIRARRSGGATLQAVADAVGVSVTTVRRALATPTTAGPTRQEQDPSQGAVVGLPVLPPAADRDAERAVARWGKLPHAEPLFAPAARVPLAGLLLAIPALEATGLLPCATRVFGSLRNGFYGLDTMLVEGVLRALAGEPRAEGATRIDPAALGRVLGLDRGPEVKTIRRNITALAGTGRADELLAAMAARHVARLDATNPDLLAVFYVDGHVRAYQGGAKVAKTHLSRLKFPAPATVETWVSDASGDPVLVVMAEPGASLAMELRRLLPGLRRAVGDDRRVLVGFDRGGWSPKLFAHMDAAGFDVLTWRTGVAQDIAPDLFTDAAYTDETGRTHTWRVADTTVDLPTNDAGEVFTMRQVSLTVPGTKTGREGLGQDATRQIHILTTRTDLGVEEVIYRMGSRSVS